MGAKRVRLVMPPANPAVEPAEVDTCAAGAR
jgi:hypothetical protein